MNITSEEAMQEIINLLENIDPSAIITLQNYSLFF